ncbi:MAG TPA: F0F1 ATP synthase subunit delta [Thiobacillaceae bacterium]|nr:F0F1 ATP synthase subunit delta [Thiobacillaceae bacterium]HNU64532.1 F0F1 ATP synthase subunit delta [Thiobacillaceae bacterium]
MERATLARPYAEAAAKLAAETRSWEPWARRLALLDAVVGDGRIQAMAANPGVESSRVADVILAVCGDALGAEGVNLVHLLAENRRLTLLPEITAQFQALKAVQEGELTAHVTSAYALTPPQLAGLVTKLEGRYGRRIKATQSTDPGLIGGVVIQVGDEVMDASVRGGLEQLAVTLKA